MLRKEDDLGFRFLRIRKRVRELPKAQALAETQSMLLRGDQVVGSETIFSFVSTSQRDSSDQNEVCKGDQRISESGRH